MTDNQRADITNGIWLCSNCHTWADNGSGSHAPADELKKMKADALARALRSLGTANTPISISGQHFARGIGEIVGLEIAGTAKNVRIEPGTVVTAAGVGKVIGTRIGG